LRGVLQANIIPKINSRMPLGENVRFTATASGKILRRHLRDPYWVGRERQVN
jgi:hypothetical protein